MEYVSDCWWHVQSRENSRLLHAVIGPQVNVSTEQTSWLKMSLWKVTTKIILIDPLIITNAILKTNILMYLLLLVAMVVTKGFGDWLSQLGLESRHNILSSRIWIK